MNKKQKLKLFLHYGFLAILSVVFFVTTGQAYFKYLDEPTSTKISRTFGDNGKGIKFPVITICATKSVDSLRKACNSSSYNFYEVILKCLRSESANFSLNEFAIQMKIDLDSFFENSYTAQSKLDFIRDLQIYDYKEKVFYLAYHSLYGPCYTVNLHRVKEFEYLELNEFKEPPT